MAKFTVHQPNGKAVSVEAPSQEAALDQVLGDSGPDVSALGSLGRGAVGMLPLGDQAYAGVAGLAEKKPYLQERQELQKEIEADKETNPGARLVGQAAGVIAPALLTGGASAPESLLEAAGQGALVGSAYGAGNAIDTVAGGGSGLQAAGDVATGAGIGAAGGAAAKKLTDLLAAFKAPQGGLEHEASIGEGAAIPHPEAPMAPEMPATPPQTGAPSLVSAQGTPMPMGQPSGLSMSAATPGAPEPHMPMVPASAPTPEPAPMGMPGNGYSETTTSPAASDNELRARQAVQLWGGTPRQIRKLPGKDIAQTVNKLVDVAQANSTPQNDLFALTDRYGDRLKKYVALQAQAGKTIGDTIQQAGIKPMPIQDVVNQLSSSMHFPTPDQEAQLAGLAKQIAAKWADKDGMISFPRLQQLKTTLGTEAFGGKGDPVLQAAYHIVGNTQDAELEKISAQVAKPAFDKAKDAYQMTSRVIPMLRMGAAKSLTGRPSLTELLSGHPMAALSKLGGERLEGIKNIIGFKVADALDSGKVGNLASTAGAVAAKQVPEAVAPTDIHLQHPAMAQYRGMFEKAMAGAKDPAEREKAMAVTDFTASQRFPGYAEAKQKAADSPNEAPKMAAGGLVTPTGFPEPQESDNPPAGAEVPVEQRLFNNASAAASGYAVPGAIAAIPKAVASVADFMKFVPNKLSDEAGAIFPDALKGTKVLGDDGNPLTVYHGTDADFDKLDLSQAGKNSRAFPQGDNIGHFFSTDKDFASLYGKNVKEAHLNLRNPVKMEKSDFGDALNEMGGDSLKAALKQKGYDGIELLPKTEQLGSHSVTSPRNYVVFDPDSVHFKPRMADGGLVSRMENKIASTGPVEGFGSTLDGFQKMVTPPTATAPAKESPKTPFNSQIEEQLRAYFLGPKQDEE